ncbi:hypothetical protein MRX96_051029, partial [Rhipicephalus microplus]
DDAQYPSKATLVLPYFFVGMTIRLFVYKRDDEGQATINVEYYKALRYWDALVEYRDHRFRFYSKSGGAGNTSYEINDVPESKFYILGIKCKDQANFEVGEVGGVNILPNSGECFGLVCVNNSGKTSLLHVLVDIQAPTGGST